MYFLPEDAIEKYPTLRLLPRCLGEVARSEKLLGLIDSDAFLNEIADATAGLAFPHFGFRGWKEHYTGYSPVWQLSYALNLWTDLLEKETGWGLQQLFQIPSSTHIPYFDPDIIKNIMRWIVQRAVAEQNWQPILDAVREIPCDEDFEKQNTNVRKDFMRKWYHTRSKRVQMVSLEEWLEDSIENEVVVSYNDSPERVLEMKEQYKRLCRALNALPEIQGRRIDSHFLLGMSQDEIANAEGVTQGAVSISISRGLESMKKLLTENFD
jgi:RNA polymerase sigma factor (sigma-70 family)